ncbi:MAG: Hybrid signal transduction histidine kinase and diguanylatecyclase/phosphodiesterase [Bacteroidota bacterium]|jgi:CheY-like chemotaxis protein|nr:Hybrid signal transduction histidine kinase and diguanylatecyclase/phosphodiesterase [Bacteroidota bacterium]
MADTLDTAMETILVIDDSQDIRENITEILELEKFKVLTAENGQVGLDLMKKEIPHLILCDINMPVLDGFGVYLNCNKNLKTAGLPFIFLTGENEIEINRQAIALGADDYMVKPFDPEILVSTIRSRIKMYQSAKEKTEQELFKYLSELEDMLFMTSHRVRAPLCTCMGLIQLLEFDGEFAPNEKEIKTILNHIKSNVSELDLFTKELTHFLEECRQKKSGTMNRTLPGNL